MDRNSSLIKFIESFNKDLIPHFESSGNTKAEQEAVLVELYLSYLEDYGVLFNPLMCPYEDVEGRNRCKVSGCEFIHDGLDLQLFVGHYIEGGDAHTISTPELKKASSQGARFFEHVARNKLDRFKAQTDVRAIANNIHSKLDRIEQVKVVVVTNGLTKGEKLNPLIINDISVTFEVYDLQRLHRIVASGSTRSDISIDFKEYLGRPLSCLQMRPIPNEYQTYLAIFPGKLLFDLYEKYDNKLLEFNVRAFLQARGKVNKGILDTLKNEPERFMAYNNGLAATADEIESGHINGEEVIHSIKGLQIVNGGQTTASIHRAVKQLKLDISKVLVQVKLTLVKEDKLDEFVPLISKYANTQNVVQVADLSANHKYHISVERLANETWCPGEEEQWFYERTRGSYQVTINLRGTTPAKLKRAKKELPTAKRFTKTDLAKYLVSWSGRPHNVSLGAQKNFSIFMEQLEEMYPPGWVPDEVFFKESIAKCLIFKSVDKIVRQAGYSYKANIVTYMVSYLSHRVSGQLNFEHIWNSQSLSPELTTQLHDWCTPIYNQIVESANGRNISEWCKKLECWEGIKELDLTLQEDGVPELQFKEDINISIEIEREEVNEQKNISDVDFCKGVSASNWARISYWGLETGKLNRWERGVAHTLSEMAASGWSKDPSPKQIKYALRAFKMAKEDKIVELG